MHIHKLDTWRHGHIFFDLEVSRANERRTLLVVLLTAAAMVVEIAAGWWFNSMALLADGWHMATHAGALGIAVFAYRYQRRHADDERFTFGAGKVETLGGFTSAVADDTADAVRRAIENEADNRVVDLHLWRVGPQHLGAIVSLVTHYPRPPEHYKALLAPFRELAHVTVEVNVCEDEPCLPQDKT